MFDSFSNIFFRAKLSNVLLSMFIFSVMAPIGIGIGTALNSVKSANSTVEMVVAIMQVRFILFSLLATC